MISSTALRDRRRGPRRATAGLSPGPLPKSSPSMPTTTTPGRRLADGLGQSQHPGQPDAVGATSVPGPDRPRRCRSTTRTVPGQPPRSARRRPRRPGRRRPIGPAGRGGRPRGRRRSCAGACRRCRAATAGPAPSSRRYSLPIPATTTRRGAAPACPGARVLRPRLTTRTTVTSRKWAAHEMHGIVVAHRLLAPPAQFVVAEIEAGLRHEAQVGLDGQLVLGGGRHDAGPADGALAVELVLVEQQPPGASVAPVPEPARGTTAAAGGSGGVVGLAPGAAPPRRRTPAPPPAPRCCGTGWCTTGPEPRALPRPRRPGAGASRVEGVAGQGPGEVGVAPVRAGRAGRWSGRRAPRPPGRRARPGSRPGRQRTPAVPLSMG